MGSVGSTGPSGPQGSRGEPGLHGAVGPGGPPVSMQRCGCPNTPVTLLLPTTRLCVVCYCLDGNMRI